MALLTLVFNRLRLSIHPSKTIGPVKNLEYLGVYLNSVDMKAYLPVEKLSRITAMIDAFRYRRKITKRELLSLLGHMKSCYQTRKKFCFLFAESCFISY